MKTKQKTTTHLSTWKVVAIADKDFKVSLPYSVLAKAEPGLCYCSYVYCSPILQKKYKK